MRLSPLLLLFARAGAFAGEQAWRRHSVSTQAALRHAKRRAIADIAHVGLVTNRGVARVFEWEHERAYRYERTGAHSYWDDPRIHNFGNVGWRGLLHAMVVPVATHAIDRFAYSGEDVRKVIHDTIIPREAEVVDLCCGVGFSSSSEPVSTRVACAIGLQPPPRSVVGVDTSEEMLAIARLRRPEVRFARGNAEEWGEDGCCDIATVMYGMHEMPRGARRRVMRNALRIARQSVLVVDIWPGFEPSPMMLSGEPYVEDFLANIDSDVAAVAAGGEWRITKLDLVEEHVTMWRMDRLIEA